MDWLDDAGYTSPIIIDSASTYPPLTEFLERKAEDIPVLRLATNVGHLAPWYSRRLHARLDLRRPVVITDCDVLPDEECPPDVVGHLGRVLSDSPGVERVGLGLRIDDLPAHYSLRDEVIAWERQFWDVEISPGLYQADVDTTFALHRDLRKPYGTRRSLRTGAPYRARHLPWYSDSANPTAEETYYRENADPGLTHWEAAYASAGVERLRALRAVGVDTPPLTTRVRLFLRHRRRVAAVKRDLHRAERID